MGMLSTFAYVLLCYYRIVLRCDGDGNDADEWRTSGKFAVSEDPSI